MRGPINLLILCASTLAVTAGLPDRLVGQRVLDMPMRTGAGADALLRGPVAVFWNPGSLGVPALRGEVLILDVRGPAPTQLNGVGVAGVMRLDPRTAVAIGFQHIGIDEIEQTTTSPLPEDGAVPLDLTESSFSFAAVRMIGNELSVGASARYTRGAAVVGGDDVVGIGAGFRYAAAMTLLPTLAAGLRLVEDGAEWFAGASIDGAPGEATDWILGGEYGFSGSPRIDGPAHRVTGTATWRGRLRLGAGLAGEPGSAGHTWNLIGGASLRLSRYVVGILREELPNDLGAVHQFRFSVSF